MPKTFHITAPDGHELEITGPDDATEEQALAQAQTLYHPSSPSTPSAPSTQEPTSLLDKPLLDISHTNLLTDKELPPYLEGPAQALKETASSLTVPKNLGMMGGLAAASLIPVVGPAIGIGGAAYFLGTGLYQTWEEAKAAYESQGKDRYYHLTNAVLSGAQAELAAKAGRFETGKLMSDRIVKSLPATEHLQKLTKDVKSVFNAKNVSEETRKASNLLSEDAAKKALQATQLKKLYEDVSKRIDIEGPSALEDPEVANTHAALKSTLDHKLINLPPTEVKRITTSTKLPSNPIDKTLAQIIMADTTQLSAETVKSLSDANLAQDVRFKKGGFEVFDTDTGKTVRRMTSEKAAEKLAESEPSFDYREIPGVPDHWVPIKDPRFSTIAAESIPGSEVKKVSNLYAPPDVAELINNYLAPGLDSVRIAGPMYNIYRSLGNILNQFQLGLSFFHAGFTMVDGSISGAALAAKKLIAGQPADAAITMAKSMTGLYSIEQILKGSKLIKGLESGTPELWQELEWLQKGGGRTTQDPFYRLGNPYEPLRRKAIREWRQGQTTKSLGHMLLALPELVSAPVLEHMVPSLKVGIFMDMAKFDMERLARQGASDDLIRRTLRDNWDSVDNRLGQIVYDNLFFPKKIKQFGMASVRSLGWNIGTFREVGGGIRDWQKFLGLTLKQAARQNREVTNRMLYTAMLPIMTALYGSVLHYAFTGKPPEDLDDAWFPQTASGRRLSLPSYMKDVVEFYEHPGRTVESKIHPLSRSIADMLLNSDYRNVHITDTNLLQGIQDKDGQAITQWLLDEGGYVAKQFAPISGTSYTRAIEEGAPIVGNIGPVPISPEAALGMIGLTPAPRSATGSAFEQRAREIISSGSPEGGRTKAQAAKSTARLHIEDLLRQGRDVSAPINEALKQGLFGQQDLERLMKEATLPQTQALGKQLSIPDLINAMNIATPEEKQLLIPIMLEKLNGLAQQSPANIDAAMKALKKMKPLMPPPPPTMPGGG